MASDDMNEVDLDNITDEATLLQLLDETEDFDERKMIRARLREVQAENRAKRDEMLRRREQDREDSVKKRAQDAMEQKKRTLAMYDQMAKSAPAGGHKVMDINIYKHNEASPVGSGSNTPTTSGPAIRRDLVEESIRTRQKEAEDRKKRILAAYDAAAKSSPAGSMKIVHMDAFKKADVSDYVPPAPTGNIPNSCTFGMSGGIPKVKAATASRPGTPASPLFANHPPYFPNPEADLDPMERAIRARVKEAEEKKRRTLAAYDIIAKTGGAGPKMVILSEFDNLQVGEDTKFGSDHRPTSSFRGGVLTSGKPETSKPKSTCCFRAGPAH